MAKSITATQLHHAQEQLNTRMRGAVDAMQQGGQQDMYPSNDNAMPEGFTNPPVMILPPEISNPDDNLTKEEQHLALGTYFANFVEYGLMPVVKQRTRLGGWKVTLKSAGREGFRLVIEGEYLIGALREADMAAGGWYVQRELEKNLVEKKLVAGVGSSTSGHSAPLQAPSAPAGVV